ncbi:MAG: CoA pyrophosphatase [Anaerolineales bacterium]
MAFPDITEAYITERLRAAQGESTSANAPEFANFAPGSETKCAAVLLPLLRLGNEWYLLYTRRTDQVETHKGQVSFPGGACDAGEEQPEQTALREAEEEIGLHARDVRLLGRLKPLLTITSFRVTPVVGLIPWPYAFRVENAEVARVFLMPLSWLANKRNRWEFSLPGKKFNLIVYHPYDGEVLWGATALMTDAFLQVLGLM